MSKIQVYLIALVAAMGGFVFGFDTGIIATTLGQEPFRFYFYGLSGVNPSYTGAIVSLYNAGQAIGGLSSGQIADRFSRKYTISGMALLTVLGAGIQAGAVHVSMMMIGRLIGGISCGALLAVVPTYIAETAPLERRGLFVGANGLMITIGFAIANWVGYAGAFAPGHAAWRVPLAMQIPVPILLTIGMFMVPFSPRWLVKQDRIEEARQVLLGLRDSETFATQELIQIQEQIGLENTHDDTTYLKTLRHLFSKQYLRRSLLATLSICMSQLTGAGVIQNYQNIFYATVGFTGRTALLIMGVYGLMGVIGQLIYFSFADKWRRSTTLWVGTLSLSVMIAICMALSAVFGDGQNEAGARAAIAMIFLYSVTFAVFLNSTIWVVASEILPFFLRSQGLAFGVFSKAAVSIVLSQLTPLAIQDVGWRFYSVFIATNLVASVIYFFFLPETGGKSLEEIAALFGDDLATDELQNIDVDAKIPSRAGHIELSNTQGQKV